MKRPVRLSGCQLALLVLTFALVSGCSNSSDGEDTKSPHVEILLGSENYKKVASKYGKGKQVKIKGELAGFKENIVKLHLADIYTGDEPAVKATDLTKDYVADEAAAKKKYNPEDKISPEIIVEGEILALRPERFQVLLKGHKE